MRALINPGLATAIAVYALLRALLLYTAFDETVMPQYELYPMGTIPKILSGAGHIPIQFHYDNAAGQLFTGVVAWPIYALIGESYLALKLVPALLGVVGLIFLHLFLRENFSARAANIGALFFALGPVPTMMKYSVFAGGNHFEHIPFAIFTLWCFYRLHREHEGSDRRWLFFTGIAMGFQLFILLGALIPILLLCFVHLGLRGVRGSMKSTTPPPSTTSSGCPRASRPRSSSLSRRLSGSPVFQGPCAVLEGSSLGSLMEGEERRTLQVRGSSR
jgi:hypothetical protein